MRDARQVLTEWLVLEAQRGSERAFRDLHDLWQADFRRMALVRLERPDAADDVLTDIWLAIARGLPRLDVLSGLLSALGLPDRATPCG